MINTLGCGHDDVIKWKHFPCYWPFVQGIHRSPVNSPHKGQWRGALMFSLICTWINSWVNNHEAGDFHMLPCPLWHSNGDQYMLFWTHMILWLLLSTETTLTDMGKIGHYWVNSLLFLWSYIFYINTAKSQEVHGIWNIQQIIVQQHVHTNCKEIIKAVHYWPFVGGIYWWPVDSII